MVSLKINSVFEHSADARHTPRLVESLVDDIHDLRLKYQEKVSELRGRDLGSADFLVLKAKYKKLLHYGTFSDRSLLDELLWKWTEVTGKYVGCQYWSVKAKARFDQEVSESGGWPITQTVAKCLENELKLSTREAEKRITHEHVFPRRDIRTWVRDLETFDRAHIAEFLRVHCVGCVVLQSEHREMDRFGTEGNPWNRYAKVGIQLADNPNWPEHQRELIKSAGLIRSS